MSSWPLPADRYFTAPQADFFDSQAQYAMTVQPVDTQLDQSLSPVVHQLVHQLAQDILEHQQEAPSPKWLQPTLSASKVNAAFQTPLQSSVTNPDLFDESDFLLKSSSLLEHDLPARDSLANDGSDPKPLENARRYSPSTKQESVPLKECVFPEESVPKEMRFPHSSFFLKFLALIPGLGILPSIIIERSLANKFTAVDNGKDAVKITKLQVNYKKISIVRDLLSIAGIVTLIALTALNPFTIAVGSIALAIGVNRLFNADIYEKRIVIKQLVERLGYNE